MNTMPPRFEHTTPVPGLIDMATPPFAEVGQKSDKREAFWYRRESGVTPTHFTIGFSQFLNLPPSIRAAPGSNLFVAVDSRCLPGRIVTETGKKYKGKSCGGTPRESVEAWRPGAAQKCGRVEALKRSGKIGRPR